MKYCRPCAVAVVVMFAVVLIAVVDPRPAAVRGPDRLYIREQRRGMLQTLRPTLVPPPPMNSSSFLPCRGFKHMHTAGVCERQLADCMPKSAFHWRGAVMEDEHCARVSNDVVCGRDVAVLLMTSLKTANRVAAAMASWVPAAQQAGMSVIVGVASEEGAAAVRAVAPQAPVVVVHAKEEKTNSGSQHVVAALRRLHADFPRKQWFAKIDDDAFLFPANLLHALAYHQINGSEPVIVGNTLFKGLSMVSGGAGYVMSAVSMRLLMENPACVDDADANKNEDSVISGCLNNAGARFEHIPGFYMSRPDEAFDLWRRHHWVGETRYPVTFHWLRDARYSLCLGCTCAEDA